MSIQGQAVRGTAAALRETRDASGGSNTSSAQGYARRPAIILANNADGTYRIDVYGQGGTKIMEDVLAFAWGDNPAALDVGGKVFVELFGGDAFPIIDATGGAGSGSIGAIVQVGSPGFISST